MLPNTTSTSTSIYINPKFRNVHINPNFLSKTTAPIPAESVTAPTQIYINPRFLDTSNGMAVKSAFVAPMDPFAHVTAQQIHAPIAEPLADTTIPTRTKIINRNIMPKVIAAPSISIGNSSTKSLIKIGSKKLVRVAPKPFPETTKVVPKVRRPLQTKYKIVKEQTTFKIDRRSTKAKLASITRKVAPVVATPKLWINESILPVKIRPRSVHRKLVNTPTLSKSSSVLNINGILYKSNRRKLEKTSLTPQYPLAKRSTPGENPQKSYCRLIVRGENFLLDASGKNLVRVQNGTPTSSSQSSVGTSALLLKRIDIGKITYVKKSNDTYERTDFHKSRYHLNVAKQRSIQMLTNRLVKSNVPCPIYRKLGKCAAFSRGKCTKLHDKKLIDVCPRFLKGTCDKKLCLLSHNLTLSKMPTCRFYLQGVCSKTDCPYLHKKVNAKTDICVDFLRGFCEKAEECAKRHEFLCPEQQSKGMCKLTRCPYPHQIAASNRRKSFQLKSKLPTAKKEAANILTDSVVSAKRYFADESNQTINPNSDSCSDSANENATKIIVVRKPTVGSLPSFIPIG